MLSSITSDCGAVDNVYSAHHYTPTPADTCEATLSAGMDIECGGFLQSNLASAIQSGVVPISVVDESLTNLFLVQLRLGMFDPVASQPYLAYNYTDKVNTPEHQALALEAAQQVQSCISRPAYILKLRPLIVFMGMYCLVGFY